MYPCGGTECHHCERQNVPIFTYFGHIVDAKLAKNPQLAEDEPDIDELCADCILSGNVRKHLIDEITATINRFAYDKTAATEAYHRFPDIPLFMQYRDWPICCGDWCEFMGCPSAYEESKRIPNIHAYWERGPVAWKSEFDLMPESLREVSLFRCQECWRMWFTWQFT
ncbi:hypothetical protein TBK1r_08040 [Stieleria magnilauensis]|uniref:Uncharacterized protein n=2 Tax=Stieleria magnilauensis TaxID=2527963 RepID=A0ABX5XJD2_9BACT|nr:hypothetical protein TBK1r_08040 [Planctomycetes bacterium TBK1r]